MKFKATGKTLATLPLRIKPVETADLDAITQVHIAAFKTSALTALGEEAIYRYYHWLLLGPHDAVALAAYQNHTMMGFCFGGKFRGALSGFVHKNRFFLGIRILTHPWLIKNTIFQERLALGLRVLQKRPANSLSQPEIHQSFGILAIAIDPQYQQRGVGRLLMQTAETEALQHSYSQMHLTVHPSNEKAIHFYEGLGWKKVSQGNDAWKGYMHKTLAIDSVPKSN